MLHAVIMAGGSGTRFWPRSRRRLPKQFLKFGGDLTLLQETAVRCRSLNPAERTWIVTGRDHAEETARQLTDVAPSHLLVEPCGRNTAPCIGLAAMQIHAVDPDAVMLIMPADHVIQPVSEFQRNVQQAITLIEQSSKRLILFGVPPTYPATGFGYIHRGEALRSKTGSAFRVAEFREKPDAATAASYVASGEFFWNCGIFVWRAETILRQIEQHAPDISARLNALRPMIDTPKWAEQLQAEFPRMPSISIDYAVLEKSADVCVIPATFAWDDVGSWQALSRLSPQDENGNTADGLFCGVHTSGCVIGSTDQHLVAAYGVHDLVIVHTPTATLIADKHDETAMRQLIAELERRGLMEFL